MSFVNPRNMHLNRKLIMLIKKGSVSTFRKGSNKSEGGRGCKIIRTFEYLNLSQYICI